MNKIFLQNPEDKLEKLLFWRYIEKKGDVVLILDGYDRVPDHQDYVTQLLIQMKKVNIKQLWVTTRTLEEDKVRNLMKELGKPAYVLSPFTRNQQIACLVKYWQMFKKDEEKRKDEATEVIDGIGSFIGSLATEFTGIALHCRILAEIVETNSAPEEHRIFKVCEELWNRRFNLCWSENLSGVLDSTFVASTKECTQDHTMRMHERRALEQLFGQQHKQLWKALPSYDDRQDCGLNTESNKLHALVAAYFASLYLNDNREDETISEFMNQTVLTSDSFSIIRHFLNEDEIDLEWLFTQHIS